MAIYKEAKILCPTCGKGIEVKYAYEIDGAVDERERKELLMGDIFLHKCDKCGDVYTFTPPMIYKDSKKKFYINAGDLCDTYLAYDELKANNPDYKLVATSGSRGIIGKVACLENGLDHRVVEIMLDLLAIDFMNTNQDKKLLDVFLAYDINFELGIFAEYGDLKNPQYMVIRFDENYYNNLVKEISSDLSGDYLFDRDTARKYITTKPEARKVLNNSEEMIAICMDALGNYHFAYNLPFNKNKFNEGDIVIALAGTRTFPGKIVKLEMVNPLSFVKDLKKLPVLGWKINLTIPKEANPSKYDEACLAALINYKKSKNAPRYFPYEIQRATAYLGIIERQNTDNNIYNSMLNGKLDEVDKNKLKKTSEFMHYTDGKNNFLSVYMSLDDIPLGQGIKAVRCKFNDIVNLFYSLVGDCEGIVVNPATDRIILEKGPLMAYKYDRYMALPGEFRKSLLSLKQEENKYFSPEEISFLIKLYLEEKEVSQVKRELGMTDEELLKLQEGAYNKFKQIIIVNY